jgi:hypothetical protein
LELELYQDLLVGVSAGFVNWSYKGICIWELQLLQDLLVGVAAIATPKYKYLYNSN